MLIKARVTERNFRNGQLDVRISSIMLLSEALERNTSEIQLNVPLTAITEEFVTGLDELVKQAKGNCRIRFQVTDPDDRTEVTLPAANLSVNASEFMKGITAFDQVDYKLS